MKEQQQVQLTRMVFMDDIPQEVSVLLSRFEKLLPHVNQNVAVDLNQYLEEKNYIGLLDSIADIRKQLFYMDNLLQDCDGVVKSYVQLLLSESDLAEQPTATPDEGQQALLNGMNETLKMLKKCKLDSGIVMFKKGDLAWTPSDTTLIKLDDFGEAVTSWCRVIVPTHVVVLSEPDGPYQEVLYRSEKWLVRTLDMYEINKEEVNNNVG